MIYMVEDDFYHGPEHCYPVVCNEGHKFYVTWDEEGLTPCPYCGLETDLGVSQIKEKEREMFRRKNKVSE